jgi:hypothetical protein
MIGDRPQSMVVFQSSTFDPCSIGRPPWRRTRLGFMCLASILYVVAYSLAREMKSVVTDNETFCHVIETAQLT